MADTTTPTVTPIAEPLFRPAKRRKFYRKRDEDNDEDSFKSSITPTVSPTQQALPETDPEDGDRNRDNTTADTEDGTHLAITEILRRRKAARHRNIGIEFTNTTISSMSESMMAQPSRALVEKEESTRELQTVANRFAPQTGQVADVDKHM